jgi:hypothetical protein
MAAAPVVPMITADVSRQQPLHELTQRAVMPRLQHEMKVIRHQREGEDLDRVAGFGECQDGQEGFVILGFVKDRRATVPSVDNVIRETSLLPTRDPRHNQPLSRLRIRPQREK